MSTIPDQFTINNTVLSQIPLLTGIANYSAWKTRMQNALQAYSLWGFVDGTLPYTGLAAVLPGTLAIKQKK